MHLVEPSKNEKELTSLKIQNQELKNKNENLQEERIELVNKYDDKLIQLSQKFNELYMQHSSTENNSNPSEQEESFKTLNSAKKSTTMSTLISKNYQNNL